MTEPGEANIGNLPVDQRAALARTARGTSGARADYVRNIHEKITSLHVVDPDVEEFAALLGSPAPNPHSSRARSKC